RLLRSRSKTVSTVASATARPAVTGNMAYSRTLAVVILFMLAPSGKLIKKGKNCWAKSLTPP
ncbi:hypothetical protein, partial [Pseudomonas aeruginosa]|uniref:hypothetical protein n=1 Tax=Pseudomonas aeruginosa TaxID=287 RepID=UPI00396876FB